MISVIVPIYNIKQYLPQCVDSLLKQTYKDFELILVDDGSTDGSSDICDFYAGQDKRIVVIHQNNGGLVAARKAGLERSKGEYIVPVDGDDWTEPDMLERLVQIMHDYDSDIIVSSYFIDNNMGDKKIALQQFKEGYYDKRMMEKKIYPKMLSILPFFEFGIFPSVWAKMFKRRLIYTHQMSVNDTITLGEDVACLYPTMLEAESCYIFNKPLYHYRVNDKSMTHAYNKMQLLGSTVLVNYTREVFMREYDGKFSNQVDFYHCMILMRNIYNIGLAGFSRGYRKRKIELINFLNDTEFDKTYQRIKNINKLQRIDRRVAVTLLGKKKVSIVMLLYCLKCGIQGLKSMHLLQ